MPDQRDVQQLIQSLTPSAVNNGNPNTVYNNPGPQGGYVPPTFDPGTNTWRINPQAPSQAVDWKALALAQPQPTGSWGPPAPQQPPVAPPVTGGPLPATPVPIAPPVIAPPGAVVPGGGGRAAAAGGGGGCVVIDSILFDYERADDVQVGNEMVIIDPVTFEQTKAIVSYSETKTVPCVRITTESGITLDCSRTAPIANEKGEQVLAPDLMNKLIPVYDNRLFYLDRVVSIEDLGDLPVRHITAEDNFFLAGKEKDRYVFHHNMKMVEGTEVNLLGLMDSLNSQFGWSRDMGGFGAESMGSRGNFRPQASSGWDGQLAPAATWDGSLTGQAGSAATPTTNAPYNPWGNMPTGYAPPAPSLGGNADLSTVIPGATGEMSFTDKLQHWLSIGADAILPGNNYLQDSKDWLGNSAAVAGVDMVLGTGGGAYGAYESNAARNAVAGNTSGAAGEWITRSRYELAQQPTSEARSAYIQRAAQQSGTTPDEVSRILGGN